MRAALDNDKFFEAIIKADTEEVSRMLKESPNLAVQEISKCKVGEISRKLAECRQPKSMQYANTPLVHEGCYDASNGFRYKPGYIAEDSSEGKWHGDDINMQFFYWDTATTRRETLQPIQLCWAPSHKEIVKLLLNCGADINIRQEIQDKRDCTTLLYNTIWRFPEPGVCSSGLREYAEYIKWLISLGALMSESLPLNKSDRLVWGTLYDQFYEQLRKYVLAAAGNYSNPDKKEQSAEYIDIMEDLSKFLFNDINRDKYIPFGFYSSDKNFLKKLPPNQAVLNICCAANIVESVLEGPGILSSLEKTLSQEKRSRGKVCVPDEIVHRLLNIVLYPVEKVLQLFSPEELRYACQNKDWYRKLTYYITKRSESINGWTALWDLLNNYVPVKEVKAGILPVTDCLKGCQYRGLEDDVSGKVKAYELALGEDIALNKNDSRMIWPVLAYTVVCLYEDYVGDEFSASDMPERTKDAVETLCGIADKYGSDINEKNPLTGQTPAHILCQYLSQAYKEKKSANEQDKIRLREQTLLAATSYLNIFKRYGADLSLTDNNGKTPQEAFPKNMSSSIDRFLQQLDYEESALQESEDMFTR